MAVTHGPEASQGDQGTQQPTPDVGQRPVPTWLKQDPLEELPEYTGDKHPQRKRGIIAGVGAAAAVVLVGIGSFFVGSNKSGGDEQAGQREGTEEVGLPGQPEGDGVSTNDSTSTTEAPTTTEAPKGTFAPGTERLTVTSTGHTVYYSPHPEGRGSVFLSEAAKAEEAANQDLGDMSLRVYAEKIEGPEKNNKPLPRGIGECIVHKEYAKKGDGPVLPHYVFDINPTVIEDSSDPTITTYRGVANGTSYPLSVQDLGNGNYRVPFGHEEFSIIKLPGSQVVEMAVVPGKPGKALSPDEYRWGDSGQIVDDENGTDPSKMSIVDGVVAFGSDDPNFTLTEEQKTAICADLYAQTNTQRYIDAA